MNERDKLLRKARRTKQKNDTSAYKQKCNEVNITVRKAKSDYYKNLLKENERLPQKFWNVVKGIFSSKGNHNYTNKGFKVNGELTSDSLEIANGFASYFSSIIKKLKGHLFPLNNIIWRKVKKVDIKTDNMFRFKHVSKINVESHPRKLKRQKACDLDNLPPGLLKNAAKEIALPLSYNNKSFT